MVYNIANKSLRTCRYLIGYPHKQSYKCRAQGIPNSVSLSHVQWTQIPNSVFDGGEKPRRRASPMDSLHVVQLCWSLLLFPWLSLSLSNSQITIPFSPLLFSSMRWNFQILILKADQRLRLALRETHFTKTHGRWVWEGLFGLVIKKKMDPLPEDWDFLNYSIFDENPSSEFCLPNHR